MYCRVDSGVLSVSVATAAPSKSIWPGAVSTGLIRVHESYINPKSRYE